MKKPLIELAVAMHRTDPSASFAFEFWDGERVAFGALPASTFRIKTPRAVRHIFSKGFHGFAESYVDGDVDVEGDLQQLLRLGLEVRFDENSYSIRQKIRFLPFYLKTRNFPGQARSNIEHHYDMSNDFYALFLDPTMSYSCAYFQSDTDTLEQAQINKFDHIARKLMLSSGDMLLDIGCGWGGLLLHCARKYGISGVGNTLSENQLKYAGKKIEDLGIGDRIKVVLRDYRELSGTFDKFVSVGMFEHVGKDFIPVYMRKVAGLLKKGGLGLLHTISKDVESPTDTWMQEYIFPGGYIPSLPEIVREMGLAGFCILDIEGLRLHYAATLDRWIANFERNAGRIREMLGGRFVRMWRMYLNSSSACFKYNGNRLYQILFTNGLNNDVPKTRDHVYRGV